MVARGPVPVRILLLPLILATFLCRWSWADSEFPVHDDLFSLTFPTEKDGWACGRFGAILHTSDGGASWVRQSSGTTFTLSSIWFTDAKNGWAVGNKGTILHTSDGGQKWEAQQSPVELYHMDVLFLNPLKGFIVSERTHILGTEDGGQTWTVKFQDEDYILKGVSFCDDLHGWAVGEFGYTYRTQDGGDHWEKQAGFFTIDPDTGDMKGDDFLFDVAALDPRTALAVGIQGIVKQTADGGHTWNRVDAGAPPVPIYCIRSGPGGVIVIGGKGVCLVSGDRAKTWRPAEFLPSVEYNWIYAISPAGAGGFAACGEEGAIHVSPAGSPVWQRVRY
ncbi:MAG: YCF48-related protein [bacterium]